MAVMAKMRMFDEKKRQQIKSQAVDFWLKSTNSMSSLFEKAETWERLYRCQLPKDIEADFAEMPDRAALVPSDVYDNIDSNVAAIMNIVFAEKPYFPLQKYGQPNVRDDQVIKAEALCQRMIDVQSDCAGFEYEAELLIKEALMFGVTAAVEVWVDKKARKPVKDEFTGMELTDEYDYPVFKEETIDSYSETQAISLLRVRVDPLCDDIRKNRIVGFHYLKPVHELIALNNDPKSAYSFDPKELEKKAGDLNKFYQYAGAEYRAYGASGMTGVSYGGKLVEIREIRGLFTVGEGDAARQMDLVVYMAGEDMLIGCKPNDLPVNSWESFMFPVVNKQKNRKYPMGLIEPIADMFLERFVKKNQSLDEAGRMTYGMYLGDTNACANLPDMIESEGNKILKIDTQSAGLNSVHDAFGALVKSPSTQDTFMQAETLKADLQGAMRNKKYTSGSGVDTATEVGAVVAGDQADLEQIVRNLKHSLFAPACRLKMIYWNYYLGSKPGEKTITDFRGRQHSIAPQELDYWWLCDFEVSTALDNMAMKRRVVEMASMVWNDPYCDPYEARKTTLTILKYPNLSQVLPPSEYLAMIVQRENAALFAGVEQPVSPHDHHQSHVPAHVDALNDLANPAVQAEMTPEQLKIAEQSLLMHIQEHEAYIEQMSESLGNTKEMGGNAGNLNNPEGASMNRNPSLVGQRR